MELIKKGAVGEIVEELQTLLTNAGCYKGDIDGLFGPGTERSVMKFQRRQNLTVDGIVGKNTWMRLRRRVEPRKDPVDQTGDYVLRLCRDVETELSTTGTVTLTDPMGDVIYSCVMLERPGPDTLESGQRKRIVEGTYRMKWQTTTGLAGVRPYLPVPWLYNDDTPDSRYIYIHNGNKPEHTYGCILAGRTRLKDFVTSSVNTLNELKAHLQTIPEDRIRVEVCSDYPVKQG